MLQIIIFSLKFVGIVFISSSYYFITSSQIIIESSTILCLFTITCNRITNIFFFTYIMFYINIYRYSSIDLTHILFHQFYIYAHEICFENVFDSFVPIIMLHTLKFKSFLLFGIHTLLDKSLRILQLPTHLSNLTANG